MRVKARLFVIAVHWGPQRAPDRTAAELLLLRLGHAALGVMGHCGELAGVRRVRYRSHGRS